MNTDIDPDCHNDPAPLIRTYAMGPDMLPYSFPAPASSIEDLTLGDVMKNKYVKELFDNFIQATNKVVVLAEDLSKVNKKYWELQTEINEMKSRYIGSWDDGTLHKKDRLSPL